MASMRDIKRRKASIQSTGQITKAMKLVATVKLQKAKTRAEQTKPYFDYTYSTMKSILGKTRMTTHPYLKPNGGTKKAIITITSNRGLAGGYNTNVTKLITQSDFKKEDVVIYPIGRKGKETLGRLGYEISSDYSDVINEPIYRDAVDIGNEVLEAYSDGRIGEIYLAYTEFKNTVSYEPKLIKLLPIENMEMEDTRMEKSALMNYEPEEEEVLNQIVPKYIYSLLFGAFVEAVASENGARMTAMDSATSNAEEMIDDLSLLYNRARQSSITQELTEIIAGAEAIN
jgi:F-type H+-transporting ATPase subunit gamma